MATKLNDATLEEFAPSDVAEDKAVVLNRRYKIFRPDPVPEFDVPGASAFVAEDRRNSAQNLIARVCDADLYPRVDAMAALLTMRELQFIPPLAWGLVPWPDDAGTRFVTISERPLHSALMPPGVNRITPMKSDDIIRRVLEPGARALVRFAQRGMAHRAIRPDNIFPVGGENSLCRLGDCAAMPAGWGQPAILEPIELMMLEPALRGHGTPEDDIYALGATAVILALGHNPAGKVSREEALNDKIEHGSYATLMRGERAPQGLREVVRGMMADDIAERWTVEDLMNWLNGTERRIIKPVRIFRSDRSLSFAGREYRDRRALSYAFGKDWKEAPSAIRSNSFRSWLQRGFGENSQVALVADLLETNSKRRQTQASDALLTSRICMRLDPWGPVRMQGHLIMPDGLGISLAVSINQRDDKAIQLVCDCISRGLAEEWCERSEREVGPEFSSRVFMSVAKYLRKPDPGFGIERCLYELNRHLPCMSPIVKGHCVVELADLLPILEETVKRTGEISGLVDRHLAAFIAARSRQGMDTMLGTVAAGSPSSPSAKLGMLQVLGAVQDNHGPDYLPHLANWITQELKKLANEYRSRSLNERSVEKLRKVTASGNLTRIYEHLANTKLKQQDMRGFAQARRRYADADRQIARLESQEFEKSALHLGWRVASTLSWMVAVATIAATILQ